MKAKHEKQIDKKYVQDQHEKMPRSSQIDGYGGLENKETGKVFPIAVKGDAVVCVPTARPIHLAAEKNGKKQ